MIFDLFWLFLFLLFFFFKQKTAYEMRISDWSSDVCSSDLERLHNTRRDGLSPCRHPGRQCQATAGQRGTAEQIAAVQYRGHIISLFIVQHPLVHSEARARYLSHPYARARRTPQMSAKISASRTRARYSRVSTAFPLIERDRKSTRRNSVTNAHLVCRLLLEKKK